MKKTFLSIALALAATTSFAAERTPEQALDVAKRFIANTPELYNLRSTALTLAKTASAPMAKGNLGNAQSPAYYVCNMQDGGFVVVSGDDRFKEVLGYSLNGTYSEADLPEGLRYWLAFLSNEMSAAIDAGYEPTAMAADAAPTITSRSIEPLIKTHWNQGKPYNNYLGGNATGCVATGMAQVMKYWRWPINGTGSHKGAFSPNYEANFGATTYDWDNMLPMYGYDKELNPDGGWETKEQVDAIATLMLHTGVATDMRWDKDASATPAAFGAYAFHTFFNYNPNLYIETRDQLSLGAWKALLIEQLQTGHPLCYSGALEDTSGGHFFICDGYDALTGKFHFNWGWSGMFDGYYEITSLEPGTGGIGAGAGKFNYWQSIFVNLQPESAGQYRPNFNAHSISFATNQETITIQTDRLTNDCTKSFVGKVGIAIYNNDGTLNEYVASEAAFPGSGFNIGNNYKTRYDIPVSCKDVKAPNGTYTACAAVRDESGNIFPIRAHYDATTYYQLDIKDGNYTFSKLDKEINLTEQAPLMLTTNNEGNVFQNLMATFLVTVKNSSAQEFNDEIGVQISGGRGTSQYIVIPAIIAAGETKTIEVYGAPALNVKDGYTVKACYGDNGTYTTFGNAITVNIKPEADGIINIEADTNTASPAIYYNLSGQRVSKDTKGIVISNGKKTINK